MTDNRIATPRLPSILEDRVTDITDTLDPASSALSSALRHGIGNKSTPLHSLMRILVTLSFLKIAYDTVYFQDRFVRSLRAVPANSEDSILLTREDQNHYDTQESAPKHPEHATWGGTQVPSTKHARKPLPEIVRANEQMTCPPGLFPVRQVVNATADLGMGRKIPMIVHMTGESKCLTELFYNNTLSWSLEGHSFYFHDYQAKQQLLQRFWPEFPQVQIAYECLKNAGGAAVADLWRYLALWQYGGIYTDMDNERGRLFTADAIDSDVDGYFLRSNIGLPSQYFFAISPKHPLMYLAVHDVLKEMLALQEVGTFYVPGTTGPRCLRRSFLKFVGITNKGIDSKTYNSFAYPEAGVYAGMLNRSVTIIGNDTTRESYVKTSSLHYAKKTDWKLMNHTDYYKLNKVPQNKSCLRLLLEQHLQSK